MSVIMVVSKIIWRICGKPSGESAEANTHCHCIVCVLSVRSTETTPINHMDQIKLKVIKYHIHQCFLRCIESC